MALFDFLNKDISGVALPVNDSGGLGVQQPMGMTWGQLGQAALKYGNKGQSNAAAFGSLLPQNQLKQKRANGDLGDIMSIFGAWMGIGA